MRVLTVSRTYDTDVADLWDACTSIERLPRWLSPVTGDLRLGVRHQLEGNASGMVERREPLHRFSATWEYGSEGSWIDVRVEEEPGGRARVTLAHVEHVADERWAEFGPGATGRRLGPRLVGLGLHLSSGGSFDPGDGEAWAVSEQGRRFVTGSSEAWEARATARQGGGPSALPHGVGGGLLRSRRDGLVVLQHLDHVEVRCGLLGLVGLVGLLGHVHLRRSWWSTAGPAATPGLAGVVRGASPRDGTGTGPMVVAGAGPAPLAVLTVLLERGGPGR